MKCTLGHDVSFHSLQTADTVFTIFDEAVIHITLVCPGILLVCWLGLVIIDATCKRKFLVKLPTNLMIVYTTPYLSESACTHTFWMTLLLKKSDVILVREVLSRLPCPILHLTYPYRLAPFSTIPMHTSNCNMYTCIYILYLYILSMSHTHTHTLLLCHWHYWPVHNVFSCSVTALAITRPCHKYYSRYIIMDLAF